MIWRTLGAIAATVVLLSDVAPQSPVFRARADLVFVEVAVRSGSLSVRGLKNDDFDLRDNGIAQQVVAVAMEEVPIDLTLILDTSDSTAAVIERFKARAQEMARMLRPADRVRLVTVASQVQEVFSWRSGAAALPVASIVSGGATSIHDALVLTLARSVALDRRHLIIAFTDGVDTSSLIDASTLAAIAPASDAALHIVLTGIFGSDSANLSPTAPALRAAAEATGGELHRPGVLHDAADSFKRVFDDFRESYLLHYVPTGVAQNGWHDITVRVAPSTGARYQVRARKGYFGS